MTVTLPNCAAKYQSFNGNLPQDTADLELAAAEQRDLQRQLQQIAGGWLQILSVKEKPNVNLSKVTICRLPRLGSRLVLGKTR